MKFTIEFNMNKRSDKKICEDLINMIESVE